MHIAQIVPAIGPNAVPPGSDLRAQATALSQLGHTVEILSTADIAVPSETEESLSFTTFVRDGPRILHASRDLRTHLQASAVDAIHHHGLWTRTLHYAHHCAKARQAPLVVSPRGAFSPHARDHNTVYKKLAGRFVHPGALDAIDGWHAANAQEAAYIADLGFKQPICLDSGGVATPDPEAVASAAAYWRQLCPQLADHRVAVFYSRLDERKRVIELIDLWLERAPRDWVLLIVGDPLTYSTQMLERYVLRNSGSGRVKIFERQGHPLPFAVASMFLRPSRHENFNLIVAEAMAHGLPAIVTDTTPWRGLNETGGGWCIPWAEFGPILTALTGESRQKLRARGMLARAWVLREYAWENSARRLADFYASLKPPAA